MEKLKYAAAEKQLIAEGFKLINDSCWKCIVFKSETEVAFVICNPGNGYEISKHDIIAEVAEAA